jgi:hypothetical protein
MDNLQSHAWYLDQGQFRFQIKLTQSWGNDEIHKLLEIRAFKVRLKNPRTFFFTYDLNILGSKHSWKEYLPGWLKIIEAAFDPTQLAETTQKLIDDHNDGLLISRDSEGVKKSKWSRLRVKL